MKRRAYFALAIVMTVLTALTVAQNTQTQGPITWENAPANDPVSKGAYQPDSEKSTGGADKSRATFLGTFTFDNDVKKGHPYTDSNGAVTFTSAALTEFINKDANGVATMIITRASPLGNRYVCAFAAREHKRLQAPTLRLQVSDSPGMHLSAWVSTEDHDEDGRPSGKGADAGAIYGRKGRDAKKNIGDSETMTVHGVSNGKAYIRFDLSAVEKRPFLSVTLHLTAMHPTSGIKQTFNVFGLNDGDPGENWIESSRDAATIEGQADKVAETRPGPPRTYYVDQNNPRAGDGGAGTQEQPFKSISKAAGLAWPGDTIVVHTGVYRERVAPARGGQEDKPIIYVAAAGEKVVIKGSEVFNPEWQQDSSNKDTYTAKLGAKLFEGLRINPYTTQLKAAPDKKNLTLGQIFVDGLPLLQVDSGDELTETPGAWMVTNGGSAVSINFASTKQPGNSPVEITVRDRIFAPHKRGLGYIHVKGFIMEHCANQFPAGFWRSDSPQQGALGCRAGHHWLIEGNTVRFAQSIGIDCGYEGQYDLEGDQPPPESTGYHIIRNNIVTDNGCCGIAGMRSYQTQIIGNVIERNNRNRHASPEIGGIKMHFFIDGLIEANLVRDNEAHGIWLDNVYRNARITRNIVVGNRADGIFIELGSGPVLIDNNIIAYTRPGLYEREPRGDGLYSHDASGILFAHNLVLGNENFGCFHRKVTDRGNPKITNIVIKNNVLIDNKAGAINLPYPGPKADNNTSDNNLFLDSGDFIANHWGGTENEQILADAEETLGEKPPSGWTGAALTFKQWQKLMKQDLHSIHADVTL